MTPEPENELLSTCKRYVEAVALDKTCNNELGKAFLAGVRYGTYKTNETRKRPDYIETQRE